MTKPSDKEALLAIKKSIQDQAGILSGWDEYTDPCIDQWTGVSCTCYPFFEDVDVQERNAACTPIAPEYSTEYSRVLQLNLGDVRITDWNVIGGKLPAAIGNLTALRVLNLRNNNFTGSIPYAWRTLQGLEHLFLSHNNISGPLPIFFRDLNRLKYVFLDNNRLTGALPYEWCEGPWWVFDIRNNPGLCDELPDCLYERIVTLEGTSIVDVVTDRDDGNGGYCDVESPFCRKGPGACTVRIPDPPFWNETTRVKFSFPDLPSFEGGLASTYMWCLGTEPGANNIVDWIPINATNSFQLIEEIEIDMDVYNIFDDYYSYYDYYYDYSGERSRRERPDVLKKVAQTMIAYKGFLPTGIGLRHGVTYYVTVRAINSGGMASSVLMTSSGISVDATPPELPSGKGVYNTRLFSNAPAQIDLSGIGVSWDPFVDPESGILSYQYQIFQQHEREGQEDIPITSRIQVDGLDDRAHWISDNVTLLPGYSYFSKVYAMNYAGNQAFV